MKKLLLCVGALSAAAVIYNFANARTTKTDIARNISIFTEIYKELQTNYVDTLDATKTMRTAIDALLAQTDPYTEYYSADEQDKITSVQSGEYAGIGSYIMKRDTSVVLSEPQWGSPARKAGVHHGDILLAIDGDQLDHTFTTDEASTRLKGQPGTDVTITVRRPWTVSGDSILTFKITRGTITIDPIPYYGYLGDGVGYIGISTFNEKTAGEFRNALNDLRRNPDFKSLIIDLRENGGGLLESAVQVASNFVPKGTTIVSTRGRDLKAEKTYKTTQNPVDLKLPIAVLIDDGTASASEILSGSLQDLDRAVIIGQRSYGKGLVQNVRPVPYDGYMKVTTGRYYIPSGRLIQAIDYSHRNEDGSVARIPDSLTNEYTTRVGRLVRDGGGITPDVTVELPEGNRLLYNIVSDFWSYDFANKVANRTTTTPDVDTWCVTDTLFNEFKSFIDPNRFKYDRATESGIKYIREAAEKEGYMNDDVKAQINALDSLLHHDLNRDLDYNKDKIVELLDNEISQRWFSNSDLVRRQVTTNDKYIEEAKLVLTDNRRYGVLLSAPAK
jgi:carboxyl-terminal processing protease